MTGTVQREMCNTSFDSLTLNIWLEQNSEFLTGARIQKIQQPTRREIILSLRNHGITKKLYININPKYYHVSLMSKDTEEKRLIEIPQKPPMFCMLLRKYLENAVISKAVQPKFERILEIYIETFNELSEKIYLCLAVELMGKHSNVILYNYDTNIIIGCAHNVGSDKSRERELAGTLPYIYPPNPPTSWYIAKKSFSTDDTQGINERIDEYFADIIYQDKFNKLKENLKQTVNRRLKKDINSLNKMEYKLSKETNSDKYRVYGDLIMANLYNNKDYAKSITVLNWETNQEITIPLDNTKTLKENANAFYKLYNKGKNSVEKLTELTTKLKENINYLEQVLYSVEIAENIEELNAVQYETEPTKLKKEIKTAILPKEIEFNGCKIFIGRNNRQNDYIISKLSKDEDYWFHTKDCAGSHVLLKCENPTDEMILKCAEYAKLYSKASKSSKVGIIYTKRKNLKKPPKANLGYVTYKSEKEIIL